MIILTNEGIRIKCDGEVPHFSEFWKKWYVNGFRFVKTKQKFSGCSGLHNFKSFTIETAA